MRKLLSLLAFVLIVTGPLSLTWFFIHPQTFWQKIITLALVIIPETLLVAFGFMMAMWILGEQV